MQRGRQQHCNFLSYLFPQIWTVAAFRDPFGKLWTPVSNQLIVKKEFLTLKDAVSNALERRECTLLTQQLMLPAFESFLLSVVVDDGYAQKRGQY